VEGSADDKRRAFEQTFAALRNRIERLVSLPAEQMDGPALRQALETIGTT
jgi:hypothetical protein